MKIMFLAYHDVNTEARTQEILRCAESLGEAYFVSYSRPTGINHCVSLQTGRGVRSYITFLIDAIRYLKSVKPDVVILHDNYTAIILVWLLFLKKRPFIIYDASELYVDRKPKGIKDRLASIMQYLEQKFTKFADVTIAANVERAKIMYERYKLKTMPIVFDNIHRIDDIYDEVECDSKYNQYFIGDKFNILYAGGISKARMIYELVDAVGILGGKYQLLVMGLSNKIEVHQFESYLREKGYVNTTYLGFLTRAEFKYFLNKANISVSAFAMDTINNIYCASGKVYESLFEGTPILTTENPPLKRICEDYSVGVSTNNFYEGIKELENNYITYCREVQNFVAALDYDNRIERLTRDLQAKISTFNKN